MTDSKKLFSLAEADDADGLIAALDKLPKSARPLSENGESLYLFALYRGRAKTVAALAARGHLSLHEAAAAGDVERLTVCTNAAPWSLGTLSADGWPALHLAAFLGRDEVVFRLLTLGADARQWSRAMDSNLAIHAAAAGRRIGADAFEALIEATGGPDIAQKGGYTALMIAAGNGFTIAVERLLAKGASVTAQTSDGKNAADFARERGHAELVALLSKGTAL
jgi:ankyrin repeat protein